MSERKPFHESIVDILNHCITGSGYELEILSSLIKSTKIPKNHDAIIVAWRDFLEREYEGVRDDSSVLADLKEQKQKAEAKEAVPISEDELKGFLQGQILEQNAIAEAAEKEQGQ